MECIACGKNGVAVEFSFEEISLIQDMAQALLRSGASEATAQEIQKFQAVLYSITEECRSRT